MSKRWKVITKDCKSLTEQEKDTLKTAIGRARNAFVDKLMSELEIKRADIDISPLSRFQHATEEFAVNLFKNNKNK